jgi:16S rRNA (uracil1498-N3)-methyltransferase
MNYFFLPGARLGTCVLGEEEHHHATRVLRLKTGDPIFVLDGAGHLFTGNLESVGKKESSVHLISVEFTEPDSHRFHLAISPTKTSERMEWMVEKAVELGLDELSFVFCTRTERSRINEERIKKIMVSAMKQSGRQYLPLLNPPCSFEDFLKTGVSGQKYIARPGGEDFRGLKTVQDRVVLLVGPEGDFTPEEAITALENGFKPLDLGKNRLRTETAGLAGVCLFKIGGVKLI